MEGFYEVVMRMSADFGNNSQYWLTCQSHAKKVISILQLRSSGFT